MFVLVWVFANFEFPINFNPNQMKRNITQKILGFVEKSGNALPHPSTLFLGLALLSLVASWLGYMLDWTVVHPANDQTITVNNLLSVEGLHYILMNSVKNFTNFAPLGIVLVAMLGIGIADKSGLIGALIRLLVLKTPKRYLSFVLVFAGIMSNFASEVGYVLLIPLGAIIFKAVGRHPIAGMAACFAGVSGGYSANLMIGTLDPLLAGLSEEAAKILDPAYMVDPTANYYFMFVSTFLIAVVGTLITEKIVEPRLGTYHSDSTDSQDTMEMGRLSKLEKKALKYASLVALGFVAVIAVGLIPEGGFLRDLGTGSVLKSPVIKGIVSFLFIVCACCGIVYGKITGVYKNDSDVMNSMADNIKTLAGYIVLVFFAAQFVAYFKESRLGVFVAVKGAELLKAADLNVYLLLLLFIIFASALNMIMGSASAKWAILAPVFVPIFMLMGYSPELSQVVFRIGDSVTNIISPMMSYFALIITYFQQYDKKSGIGTIMSCMLPYSVIFFIAWTLLLFVWINFELPLGPGVQLYFG